MPPITPLLFAVSSADPRSITRQIIDGIRLAIAEGEIPVGSQLPSVRGLAQQLAINPKTVAKAYDDLVAEGWLYARHGLGLFVAPPRQMLSEAERKRRFRLALDTFAAEVYSLGYPLDFVLDHVRDKISPMLERRRA